MEPATFKDRVTRFWDWFADHSDQFYDAIEDGSFADHTKELTDFLGSTFPGLSWVFGPGENGGHSFTLTGEGQVAKQLLAEYWLERSTEISRWSFFGSRQPTPPEMIKDFAIQLGDHESLEADSVWLKTAVDAEAERIDIVVWHDALHQVPEEHHLQLVYLLLDEALGEFGTQTWIGDIRVEPIEGNDADKKRLMEIPDFIGHVEKYYEWEKISPIECYSVYEVTEQNDTPRGDSVTGITCIPHIILEFLENGGSLDEDPLAATGAELAYLAIDGAIFPNGQQSEVRGNIEDAVGAALTEQWSGRALGGAFGLQQSYIDLLLLDGDRSRQIVSDSLSKLQLDGKWRLENLVPRQV